MNYTKLIFYSLAISLLTFSCGSGDDTIPDNTNETYFFNADFDGIPFMTDEVSAQSVFGLHAITVTKDDDEIEFQLSGRDPGTYEVGGADKSVAVSIGITYTSSSGSVTVTSFNEDTKVIEGTVDEILLESGLPGVPEINITNGDFKAKFPL